jgi:hypothetical protein
LRIPTAEPLTVAASHVADLEICSTIGVETTWLLRLWRRAGSG